MSNYYGSLGSAFGAGAIGAPKPKVKVKTATPPKKGKVVAAPKAVSPVKCKPGYYVKKTWKDKTGKLHFECAKVPPGKFKPKFPVIKLTAKAPTASALKAAAVTLKGGLHIGKLRPLKIRGPFIPLPISMRPMTTVATQAGAALVVATPAGNVAIPGAVPAPSVAPGSSVSTPAGPATVVDTPDGNVAIPDAWAPDDIDELDPPVEGAPQQMTPEVEAVASVQEAAAAAEEAVTEAVTEVAEGAKKATGLSGTTLLMIGGAAALLFFMSRKGS